MTTDLPLIPARDVVAHFARWAVQLAPLGMPERLPECLAALRVYVGPDTDEWHIDSVRELLTRFTASDPVVRLWSYPLVQQDDPGELPSEENRFIQRQDLVDSVIASLLVEARHAQEVHRTQGSAAEPLLRQGYRVYFRPGGQSECVDFGAVTTEASSAPEHTGRGVIEITVRGPSPLTDLLAQLTRYFPEHFSAEAHGYGTRYYGQLRGERVLIFNGYTFTSGWRSLGHCLDELFAERGWTTTCEFSGTTRMRFRMDTGAAEYIVYSLVDSAVSFAELAATALLAVPREVSE